MAKYYLLPYTDGEAIMGEEVIKRYDHNPENTLCIIETRKAVTTASKKKLSWMLTGKEIITQEQREDYVRTWYPTDESEGL